MGLANLSYEKLNYWQSSIWGISKYVANRKLLFVPLAQACRLLQNLLQPPLSEVSNKESLDGIYRNKGL